MKKFFTLLAGFAVAFSGFAEDELPGKVTYEAKKGATPADNTVELTYGEEDPVHVITAVFLNNTSKGSTADAGTWTWGSGNYATTDQNSCEVQFTPSYGGVLAIKTAAEIALNKSVCMFVDEDPANTMDATYGEWTILNGIELQKQEFNQTIPANSEVTYQLQKGRTYNFYFSGTKWRLGAFSFTPTDNDDPGALEDAKKIAVVSPLGEEDPLYFAVQEGFEPTFISDATDVTLESLQEYEALLISNAVTADSPFANVLRSAVAYQPVVNLSAALVEAWGLGTVADTESNTITVAEENVENALFANLSYDEGLELIPEGTLPVVTPGEYFANDNVLATVGDKPYILVHNASRNAHILIPLSATAVTDGEVMTGLVANALNVAAKTKRAVTKTGAPKFSAEQGNLETFVTITGAGVVRYAIGADAEVTAESALYTEPIRFTESTMLKAIAHEDGYLVSDVATYEVPIAAKAERPVITVTPGEGKSAVITLTAAEEGAEIHYSFMGQAEDTRLNALKTATYAEPIVVTEPTIVYAFTTGENLLPSDLEEMNVAIPGIDASNIRLDEVSHFSARQEWNQGASYPAYVGKADGVFAVGGSSYKAYSYYTDQVDHYVTVKEQAKDDEGNAKVDENGEPVMVDVEKPVYKVDPEAYNEITCEEEPDWKVVTEGQQLCFENVTPEQNVLGANGNGYETPFDLIDRAGTNKVLSFKGVGKSNDVSDPSTARVESAKAFQTPFDVVVYIRNNKATAASVLIQTSADGKEWTDAVVADAGITQRTVKRTRYSVEGEGSCFVRVMHHKGDSQVQDIFIYNNGEESKKYTGEFTGLEEIADEAAEVISVEYYNLSGMRIAEPENGFCIMRAILSNGNVVVKKIVK